MVWCIVNLCLYLMNQHVLFEPTQVGLCNGEDAGNGGALVNLILFLLN